MPYNRYQKKVRIQYTKEALKEAMAAVNAGMPILRASVQFKIPRSTLHNKQRSKNIDKKPGPDTCLTSSQEEMLAQWVFDCSDIGMPIGRQQVQDSVPLLLKSLGRGSESRNVGRRWYQNFLHRNDRVVARILTNNTISRAAATEGGIRNWFANVERYLQEKSLFHVQPSRVFSTDTVVLGIENSENLCVQMAGNAAGQLTCPMVTFSEMISDKMCKLMPPGWMIAKSESGSVTAENFYEYIKDNFHPWLVANNIEFPIALFLNGRLHMTLTLTNFCREHKIELISFHPNSSNLLHPLENLFSPLKAAWKQTKLPAKEDTAPCLKSTLDKLNVAELLMNGFVNCGIYPFSVDSVYFRKLPDRLLDKVQSVEFGPFVSNVSSEPVKKSDPVQEQEEVETTPSVPTDELTEEMPKSTYAEIFPSVTNDESVEQMPKITDAQFLELFEQKINPNTLQSFKNAQQSDVWTGCKEDTTLYYIWKDAVNLAMNSCSTNTFLNFTKNHDDNDTDIEFDNVDACIENKNLLEDAAEDPLKICTIEMEEQ